MNVQRQQDRDEKSLSPKFIVRTQKAWSVKESTELYLLSYLGTPVEHKE